LAEQRFLEARARGIVTQPDLQQRAVDILARDRVALHLTVQGHEGAGIRQPVDREDVAFPALPDGQQVCQQGESLQTMCISEPPSSLGMG